MVSPVARPLAVARGGHLKSNRSLGKERSDDSVRRSRHQTARGVVGWESDKPRDALSVKAARCVVGLHSVWIWGTAQWRENRRWPIQQKTSQPIAHRGGAMEASISGLLVLECPGQWGSGQWLSLQTNFTGPSSVCRRR